MDLGLNDCCLPCMPESRKIFVVLLLALEGDELSHGEEFWMELLP